MKLTPSTPTRTLISPTGVRQVLVIDDDADTVLSTVRLIKQQCEGVRVEGTSSPSRALAMIDEHRPAVVTLDMNLDPAVGTESGLRLLDQIVALDPTIRVIVITGEGNIALGASAIERGAAHFLDKPVEPALLVTLVHESLRHTELRRAFLACQPSSTRTNPGEAIIGESAPMQHLKNEVAFLASNDLPVLIIGETGTGKGLVAREIHRQGERRDLPFLRYQPNFSNSDLVMSELFGHHRGAFTGATEDRAGLIEEAGAGTLFLDEIDELPHNTQVALLGVLQDRSYRRIGGNRELKVSCRFVCATNRPIEESLSSGKLRRDLYHRLAHVSVYLPPLRARRSDIPLLAQYVMTRVCLESEMNPVSLSARAEELLLQNDWPGNVRELQGVIEVAVRRAAFARARQILPEHLGINASSPRVAESAKDLPTRVESYRRRLVEEALAECSGNQSQAAEMLGIDRNTLRRIVSRKVR